MYSLLLSVIYLSFVSLGLPDSLLGSAWPVMHGQFGASSSELGMITMVMSFCTVISSLTSDRMTKRFSVRLVTLFSVVLSAVSLIGYSYANRFWMLMALAVPYGLAGGAIDAALNNYVALHYNSKHMSWLHSFWGVGTIISPFIMSRALTVGVWNDGYIWTAYCQFAIALVLVIALPLWKVNQGKNQAVQASGKSVGIRGALKIKGVPYQLLGFLGYCAAESTAMGWSATYFVEVKGIGEEQAAALASLFFIGLTAGRFLGGFIMDRVGDRNMIRLGTGLSLIGITLLLLPLGSSVCTLVGFVMIGFGFAPIYPCIIHATPHNFGAEYSGAIIGMEMAGAYIGSTFMPPLYGMLGGFLGFEIMPVFLLIFVGLMIVMTEKTFRVTARLEEQK